MTQGEWLRLDTVGQSNKPPLKEWRCLALDLGEKKVEQKCGVFCIDLISSVVLCGRYHCYFTTGEKTKSQRVEIIYQYPTQISDRVDSDESL